MEAIMETLGELLAYAERRGYELDDMKTRTIRAIAFTGGYILYDSSKFDNEHELACAIAHEIGHQETYTLYKWNSPVEVKAECERRADEWAAKRFRGYISAKKQIA